MHAPEPASSDGDTTTEAVQRLISAVITRRQAQLLTARRSGDQQRQDEIDTRLQACLQDQNRLAEAGPEELERLAAQYTEQLNALRTE
ncbi:hypothetical protein [Streptacidiphilus anmyonensis]|uniref:hypothetical protein n=1 Tax=Streptacidiphilus anmyonensis TaxID=405782 RepID=UPI0005A84197|nr:hypothetical protein [Streptacidiphilus anmyonensis]